MPKSEIFTSGIITIEIHEKGYSVDDGENFVELKKADEVVFYIEQRLLESRGIDTVEFYKKEKAN